MSIEEEFSTLDLPKRFCHKPHEALHYNSAIMTVDGAFLVLVLFKRVSIGLLKGLNNTWH